VTRGEVGREARRLKRLVPELLGPGAASGFLRLPRRTAALEAVRKEARRWRRRGIEDVIHIGIGGSSLGAEALSRALLHPQHAQLPSRLRRGPRLHFVDNVDPDTLGALLEWVDLRHALVHVVSKSGGTVETAAGFQIVRQALEGRRGIDWREHCVFTTGTGALGALARAEGVATLDFPADVGGRFSVLTPSGLFTPAVAGVDVAAVVAGARQFAAKAARREPAACPATAAACVATLLEARGKPIHVLMPYADSLEPLARWFVQLAGESLGKIRQDGRRRVHVGPTPLPARGSTDQHSQVQLFVEGPADKLVTFVRVAKPRRSLRIPGDGPAPYLDGVRLEALLDAELRGTEVALARAGRPSVRWELPDAGPHALGQLLVALELQVACQAALLGVDAYDQPGVEAGKVAAFALIGREGYEDERKRIEALRPPRWTL
jgi:glucose-6-phosphate isomerase